MSTVIIENHPDSSPIAKRVHPAWSSERIVSVESMGVHADGSIFVAVVILTAGQVGMSDPLSRSPINAGKVDRVLIMRNSAGEYVGDIGKCVHVLRV